MTFPCTGETVNDAVVRGSSLIAQQAKLDICLHPGLRGYSEDAPPQLAAYREAATGSFQLTVRAHGRAPLLSAGIGGVKKEGKILFSVLLCLCG
jgi:hypothetical protein